ALPSEIGQEPFDLHPQPVLQLWKRHEMQGNPNEPSDKSTHAKTPALQDREIFADDRHVALIVVPEWVPWRSSLELSRDQPSDIASFLDRRLSHAWHWPSIAHDR